MINRTKTMTAAAALAASVAFAGCGSDGSDGASAPPAATTSAQTTSPAGTSSAQAGGAGSELAAWTTKFCGAINAAQKPLQPPSVSGTSPGGTQASLVTFFSSVVSQQAAQIHAIEQAGPPPGADAKKAWKKAERDLRTVRKSVAKVVRKIQANKASSASDVKSLVTDLGAQMKKLGAYQGPIAELGQSKPLSAAIAADATCQTQG